MSLHRSCCPCGDCYRGTLCTPCIEPCDGETQPPETVYISEREWGLHAADVPGSGSGWVIYVGGAWYFFDGSTTTCEGRSSDIDWLIAFRADECPDFSIGVDIVVPFSGGFDFSVPWNVAVDIGDIADPTACVQGAWSADFPGTAPVVISATQPEYHGWDMDIVCVSSDPITMTYGAGGLGGGSCAPDYDLTGGSSMTQCGPPGSGNDVFGYTGECVEAPTTYPASETSIEGCFSANTDDSTTVAGADAITFTATCPTGTFAFEIENVDADGYFVVTINSACVIRFIGPVTQFAHAFNATFAGAGITCTVNDEDWFLGCKVRAAYVGTGDQASFPYTSVTSSTSFTLATFFPFSDTEDVDLSDIGYGPLIGAAGFNGSTNVVTDAPYTGPKCPAGCGGANLPAGTGFTATGTHPSGSGGYVRERYGISLAPSSWTWVTTYANPGDPCEPDSMSWTVT